MGQSVIGNGLILRMSWFSSNWFFEFSWEEVHPSETCPLCEGLGADITFKFPFGEHELGIAARGNFDLTQHQEHSGRMEF